MRSARIIGSKSRTWLPEFLGPNQHNSNEKLTVIAITVTSHQIKQIILMHKFIGAFRVFD